MTILATLDTKTGEIRRYMKMQDCEIVQTHHGIVADADFRPASVEGFRRFPPESCKMKYPHTVRKGGYEPTDGAAA